MINKLLPPPEIYVSTDVETDGPIPGPHSMLSFGSAAYQDGEMIGTFQANLELLKGAHGHPATMEWWKSQPKAWEAHRKNLQDPAVAMQNYVTWVVHLPGKPVFVGYPAGFDFLFMYWYMIKFTGRSPFSFSALDIKTYVRAARNRPDMLNTEIFGQAHAVISVLEGMDPDADIFMRPSNDLKQFTGAIFKVKEARDFLKDALECTSSGSYKIEPDFYLVLNKPKKILSETRWFIVGGQVIDGSMYRRNGELYKQHIVGGDWPAGGMVEGWLPHECCVMDTCVIENDDGKIETKVVEFNCINGSGFYDHDIKKIMHVWWKYHNN